MLGSPEGREGNRISEKILHNASVKRENIETSVMITSIGNFKSCPANPSTKGPCGRWNPQILGIFANICESS